MTYYPEGTNNALLAAFDDIEDAKEVMRQGRVVEGRVRLCDREHNLHIDLGGMKGIIPRNEGALGIKQGTVRDIALISKVGKRVCCRVVGFHRDSTGEMIAVLSRRLVQEECMRQYIDGLRPGDVIPALVTHLEKFGAFIDIGAGINSLIPIDMLSVSRISHPAQRLCNGDVIHVVLSKREAVSYTHLTLPTTWPV